MNPGQSLCLTCRPRGAFLRWLTAVALLLGLPQCATVPFTGRPRWALVSDRALGAQVRQAFAPFVDSLTIPDSVAANRLRRVSQRLTGAVAQLARDIQQPALLEDIQWQIYPLPDRTPNAFALSGGVILLHTRLLEDAPSDTAVAVVVAHEMAHVICRHAAESSSKVVVGVVAQLAVVGARISAAPGDTTLVPAFTELQRLGFLAHSRRQEAEADEVGQYLLALAGWPPTAQAREWRRMAVRYPEIQYGDFESTHPGMLRRARLARRVEPLAWRYYRGAPQHLPASLR